MCGNCVKKPTTIDEQILLLESRGCNIADKCFAKKILSQINYYRFTAYFLPYKKNGVEEYTSGACFEKAYHTYEFDRKIRNILISIIEEIEVMIRTQISYFHAHKYGALGYMDLNNFDKKHDHKKFLDTIRVQIDRNKNLLFVKHHIDNCSSNFPLWVVSELLTIGDVYYFYADMHLSDMKTFAKKYFKTSEKNLKSWFVCLRQMRNCCAHFSRLYYSYFNACPRTPKNFPLKLGRRLFDYLLVLSFLYPDEKKWEDLIFKNIENTISEYSKFINLNHIGFPQDWKKYLRTKM